MDRKNVSRRRETTRAIMRWLVAEHAIAGQSPVGRHLEGLRDGIHGTGGPSDRSERVALAYHEAIRPAAALTVLERSVLYYTYWATNGYKQETFRENGVLIGRRRARRLDDWGIARRVNCTPDQVREIRERARAKIRFALDRDCSRMIETTSSRSVPND